MANLRTALQAAAVIAGLQCCISVQALPLEGESFENGALNGWDISAYRTRPGYTLPASDAVIVDQTFGSDPADGQYQALLTTSPEYFFEEGGVKITHRDAIQLGSQDLLTFNWNFLTNEIPYEPFYDAFDFDNPFNDKAGLQLTNVDTGEIIDIVLAAAKEFDGQASSTTFNRETGSNQFSQAFSSGTYWLSFYITDVGDFERDSGLLLDNIRIMAVKVPEPSSTLLLAGALLALGVFRRQRNFFG